MTEIHSPGKNVISSMTHAFLGSLSPQQTKSLMQQFEIPQIKIDSARRKRKRVPAGELIIHFTDNLSFTIEFFEKEPIKELKERIEEKTKICLDNYTISCKNGTLQLDKYVTDYLLQHNSRLIIFEKGAARAQQRVTRDRWIESKHSRRSTGSDMNFNFLKHLEPHKPIRLHIEEKPRDIFKYKYVGTFL